MEIRKKQDAEEIPRIPLRCVMQRTRKCATSIKPKVVIKVSVDINQL